MCRQPGHQMDGSFASLYNSSCLPASTQSTAAWSKAETAVQSLAWSATLQPSLATGPGRMLLSRYRNKADAHHRQLLHQAGMVLHACCATQETHTIISCCTSTVASSIPAAAGRQLAAAISLRHPTPAAAMRLARCQAGGRAAHSRPVHNAAEQYKPGAQELPSAVPVPERALCAYE